MIKVFFMILGVIWLAELLWLLIIFLKWKGDNHD